MADNFTITRIERTSEGYSIWEVTRKVIREHYYPNNQDVAETLINGDRTAYNRLVVRIRELNNLANGAQYVSSNKSTILIPTLDEFQELMLPLSLHNTQAPVIEIINTEQRTEEPPQNITIISAGHGMDRPGQDRGAVDTDGIYEVNYIYRFTQKLYPAMDKLSLRYINLKAEMEAASMVHTAENKIIKSNEIFDSQRNISLHFAVHADAVTNGYEGITLLYIDGATRSRRIADFFSNKLTIAGFLTRVRPDTITRHRRLGELRNTKAPVAYIEIGSIDTVSSRTALNGRMVSLAITLAEAIRAFNIERPNL